MSALARRSGTTPSYGGQAVIEGVLMRGSQIYSVAVRAPDGSIRAETQSLGLLGLRSLRRIPLLRGLIVLWEALVIGIRALTFSANAQAETDRERIEGASLFVTVAASLAIGIAAFLLFPAALAHFGVVYLPIDPWLANLLEGLIRLGLLVGYVWAIGRHPEIERVFGYHGAEHMTIHAFESDAPLTLAEVARFPREHPRCGTAFLLTVAIVSIVLFGAIGPLPLLSRLISRILLIPVLAGLSYEYIRFSERLQRFKWAKPLIWPNLALQRLTTRIPDQGMIEVAIAAFERMRAGEAQLPAEG